MSLDERKQKFNQILYSMINKLDTHIDDNNETLHKVYDVLAVTAEPEFLPRSASSEQGQRIFNLVAKAEQFTRGLEILERELAIQFPSESDITMGDGGTFTKNEFAELESLAPPGSDAGEYAMSTGIPDLGGSPVSHGMPDLSGLDMNAPGLSQGGDLDMEYKSTAVGEGAFVPPWSTTQESAIRFKKRERAAMAAKPGTKKAAELASGGDISGNTPDTDTSEFSARVSFNPKGSKFPITFVARLYRHKYWIGEPMKVYLDFHNMSSATGKSVQIVLYRRTVLRKVTNEKGTTFYVYKEKKPEVISKQLINPMGFPVKPKSRFRKDVVFKIPFHLTPSSSDCRTGDFPIVYHLEVTVVTNKQNATVLLERLGLFDRFVDDPSRTGRGH